MNIKQLYTQEELDYIRKNYDNMTVREIAKNLNRNECGISTQAKKMGLSKQSHKQWTDEEIQYLKDNYIDKTSEEIGQYLGRPINSINSKRDELGLIRHEGWSKEEIDFLVNNFEIMTHLEIGKKINRTEQAVRAKCFDLNLYKKELPWTDEEIIFVKENYMEMTTSDISSILNRTPDAVQLKARKLGLKKYPYYCDYHYFDNIDTEEKAYWLGFLTADGWINKNEKNNAGVTGIELQYGDINHLKKFNKSIGGNYQITDRWRPCMISKYPDKKHHMCVIRIFSLTMYNSLIDKGFTKDKSYDFHIPDIRQDLIRHYLRGYFDGDGCFTFTNKSFHINFITASKMLNDDIYKILDSEGFHFSESSFVTEFNTRMYRINIFHHQDKINFLDWIYGDCTIYLDRKYKKYLKVKERYNNSQSLAV